MGGDIATRDDAKNRMYSEKAYYQVDGSLVDNNQVFNIRVKGILVVNGESRSVARRFFLKTASVLIRESGF